jgi:hypothetical protein
LLPVRNEEKKIPNIAKHVSLTPHHVYEDLANDPKRVEKRF